MPPVCKRIGYEQYNQDAKKCNEEMQNLKERNSNGVYRYFSDDYFRHRDGIFVKFKFFVKDPEGKWGFYGILQQASNDGKKVEQKMLDSGIISFEGTDE